MCIFVSLHTSSELLVALLPISAQQGVTRAGYDTVPV